MFVVDTNVLLYAADRDSPFHVRCRELVETWRHQVSAWYLTWGICYEFLRVSTHPRVLRNPWTGPRSWAFLEVILASPGIAILVPSERHASIVAEVITELPHLAGNLMHDLHIAALMREHGIGRIYTRDMDFHRFPFVEVLDPMSETV